MIRFLLVLTLAGLAFAVAGGYEGGLLANLFGEDFSGLGLDVRDLGAMVGSVILLLLVLPGLLGGYRGRSAGAIRDLLSWTALGVVLIGGYSYREELGRIAYRIAGELTPPGNSIGVEQRQTGAQSVRIRRRSDGHFVARVAVNGQTAAMLVDTGASTVVLRQVDARALGVDTRRLRYSIPVQTANGLAYAAHTRLREIAIGSITLRNVDALIAQPGALKESLLGMSFLSRLRSYEFAGDFLTFRN